MIRFLDGSLESGFLSALRHDRIEGVRIYTLYALYGNNTSGILFWVQLNAGIPVAALAGCDGILHISAAESADTDELWEFINFMGFKHIYASSVIYNTCTSACDYRKSAVMELKEAPSLRYGSCDEASTPSLMDVYALLSECSPGFAARTSLESWYAHTSLLLRREVGRCLGIYRGGRLVSTAGVYATSPSHALIGGVATSANYRQNGFANSLVNLLICQLSASNLMPITLSDNEITSKWYNSLGFIPNVENYELFLKGNCQNEAGHHIWTARGRKNDCRPGTSQDNGA